MPETGALRVKLSPQVDADALARLHGGRFEAPPFGELFARAGAAALRPVYDLSAEEIAEDKYGFAREFSLELLERGEEWDLFDARWDQPVAYDDADSAAFAQGPPER